MKKTAIFLFLFLTASASFAETKIVKENLRLREDISTSSKIIASMTAGTKVQVLSKGKEETIDGIKSNWVKVNVVSGKSREGKSINGKSGWCFGGYLVEDGEWTSEDLKNCLVSIENFKYKSKDRWMYFGKDGTFSEGFYEKGEPVTGTWSVLSPGSVEIVVYSFPYKEVVSEITPDYIRLGDNIIVPEKKKMPESIVSRLPYFCALDKSNLVETGGIKSKYYYFDESFLSSVKEEVEVRDKPNGNKTSCFYPAHLIQVTSRTFEKETVDGVTDYWYYASCDADMVPWGGWIFGTYLKGKVSSGTFVEFSDVIRETALPDDQSLYTGSAEIDIFPGKQQEVMHLAVAYDKNGQSIKLYAGTMITIDEIIDLDIFSVKQNDSLYPYVVFTMNGTRYIVNSMYFFFNR